MPGSGRFAPRSRWPVLASLATGRRICRRALRALECLGFEAWWLGCGGLSGRRCSPWVLHNFRKRRFRYRSSCRRRSLGEPSRRTVGCRLHRPWWLPNLRRRRRRPNSKARRRARRLRWWTCCTRSRAFRCRRAASRSRPPTANARRPYSSTRCSSRSPRRARRWAPNRPRPKDTRRRYMSQVCHRRSPPRRGCQGHRQCSPHKPPQKQRQIQQKPERSRFACPTNEHAPCRVRILRASEARTSNRKRPSALRQRS